MEPPAIVKDASPIFILGCPRTGTSAMVHALRAGCKIRGFSEGHINGLMNTLFNTIDKFYDQFSQLEYRQTHLLIANVEKDEFKNSIRNFVAAKYLEHMGSGVWLDKSPGPLAVRSCSTLLEMFPNARFVFCKRRAIENILSQQRKFPNVSFKKACSRWADTMHHWQKIRGLLHDRYLEVDQHDMAVNPARVAGEIREFLDLSDEQQEAIERDFTKSRVQQTRAAQDQWLVDLNETGWTDAEKAIYNEICKPMVELYGYSNEANRTGPPAPIELFFPVKMKGIVELHNVDPKSGSFARAGGHGFQLQPNAPGKGTAEVRYLGLILNNHHQFAAKIRLANKSTQPVLFGFRIEDPLTRQSLTSEEKRLTAEDSPFQWTIDFPPLIGKYDVIVSTRMADDTVSADGVAARWISPTFA